MGLPPLPVAREIGHTRPVMSDHATPAISPAGQRDLAYHLHPSTKLRQVQSEGPLVITRGEGVYVYDDEGRRYLEGMAGLWCASLGFSERVSPRPRTGRCASCRSITASAARSRRSVDRARRAPDRASRPAGWAACCSRTRAPRRTTRRSSSRGTVNNALGRPEKKKIIARATRVPRRDDRGGEPHRARVRASPTSTCRCPASCTPSCAVLLSRRASRRIEEAVRDAARRRARGD